MNDHVVNDQNEASNIQRNDDKIYWYQGRRFKLTRTSYSFLDIAVSVRLRSHVEIMLRNRSPYGKYQIILPHETWIAFIKERRNVEQFLQSPIGSSLSICDLVLKLVLRNDETLELFTAVKLTVHDHYINVKPDTLQYLFEIEKRVEDEYSELCQYTDSVNEKYKHFVNNIRSRDITECITTCNSILQDFDLDNIDSIEESQTFDTKFVKLFKYAFED